MKFYEKELKKILILQKGECFLDLPLSPVLEILAHLV